MTDLLYGAAPYQEELEKLFPSAKFTDASDEIHEGRIQIEVEMPREEYYRKICLNGFGPMSLSTGLLSSSEFQPWIKKWRKEYPECFEKEDKEI